MQQYAYYMFDHESGTKFYEINVIGDGYIFYLIRRWGRSGFAGLGGQVKIEVHGSQGEIERAVSGAVREREVRGYDREITTARPLWEVRRYNQDDLEDQYSAGHVDKIMEVLRNYSSTHAVKESPSARPAIEMNERYESWASW